MKSIALFSIAVLTIGTAIKSQPTITSSTLPSIGMEVISKSFNANDFEPGPNGANITWDFSGITVGANVPYTYTDPSTISGHIDYPNSNICAVGDGDYRVFLEKSSTEYISHGAIYSSNGSNARYNNPQELIFFPITYTDIRNESFGGVVDWKTSVADRYASTVIEADAYGTLILPNETINDVLRVKTVDNISDTSNGTWQVSYKYTTYQWYTASRIGALLTWRTLKTTSPSGTSTDTTGEALFKIKVGIQDEKFEDISFNIYPNPCSDHFNFTLNSPYRQFTLEVININGQIVTHQEFNTSIEGNSEFIDVSNLPSGIYSVLLSREGFRTSKRLIIKH